MGLSLFTVIFEFINFCMKNIVTIGQVIPIASSYEFQCNDDATVTVPGGPYCLVVGEYVFCCCENARVCFA